MWQSPGYAIYAPQQIPNDETAAFEYKALAYADLITRVIREDTPTPWKINSMFHLSLLFT